MSLHRKPRKGDRVHWRKLTASGRFDGPIGGGGVVLSVDEDLCRYEKHDGTTDYFIWKFRSGMNEAFTLDMHVLDDELLAAIAAEGEK